MMMKHLICSATIVLALLSQTSSAFAADIVGQYSIEGANPSAKDKYSGGVMVTRKGDVYTVGWKIGEQEHIGTGLVQGDSFAVVYLPREGKAAPGLVIYTIMPNGILVGRFTSFGGTGIGNETWKPSSK